MINKQGAINPEHTSESSMRQERPNKGRLGREGSPRTRSSGAQTGERPFAVQRGRFTLAEGVILLAHCVDVAHFAFSGPLIFLLSMGAT